MKSNVITFCKKRLFADKPRPFILLSYLLFSLIGAVYLLSVGQIRNSLLCIAYFALVVFLLFAVEYFMGLDCRSPFLLIVLTVPVGGILGTCFEFYMIIPFFDTLLHTVSGFIFAALGYALMERILGGESRSSRVAAIMFAVAFSLALAVLWEMFEWALTVITSGDMQEDSIVNEIRSYLLSGSHNTPVVLEGITKTEIHYSTGEIYVVNGGYLDLGLGDTLLDMLVCLIGSVVFFGLSLFDLLSGKRLVGYFAPSILLTKEENER